MQNVLDGLWDIHSRTVGSGISEEIWNTLGKKGLSVWYLLREVIKSGSKCL